MMDLYYLGKDSSLASGLERALSRTEFKYHRTLSQITKPNKIDRANLDISYLILVDTDTVSSFSISQFKRHMNAGAYFLFVASETQNPRPSKILKNGKKSEEAVLKELEEIAMPRSYNFRFGSLNLELSDYLGERTKLGVKSVNLLQRDHSSLVMNEKNIAQAKKVFSEMPNIVEYFTSAMKKVSEETIDGQIKEATPISLVKRAIKYALEEYKSIYEKWKAKNGAQAYLGFIDHQIEQFQLRTLDDLTISIPADIETIYLNKLIQSLGLKTDLKKKEATLEKEYTVKIVDFSNDDRNREDKTKVLDEKIHGWHDLYMSSYSKFSEKAGVKQDNREKRASRLLIYDFAIAIRDENDTLVGMSYYSLIPEFDYRDCLHLSYPSIHNVNGIKAVMGSFMIDPKANKKPHIINLLLELLYKNLRLGSLKSDVSNIDIKISAAVHPKAYSVRQLFFDRKLSINEFFLDGFYNEKGRNIDELIEDLAMNNPVAIMSMHEKMFLKYLLVLESKYMENRQKYKMYDYEISNNQISLPRALRGSALGKLTHKELDETINLLENLRKRNYEKRLFDLLGKRDAKGLPGQKIERDRGFMEDVLGEKFFDPEMFEYIMREGSTIEFLDFMFLGNMSKGDLNYFLMRFFGREIIREKFEVIGHELDLMFIHDELQRQQLELEKILDKGMR